MKKWLGTQLYLQVPFVVPAGSQFGNSIPPRKKKVFPPLFFQGSVGPRTTLKVQKT